MLWLPPPGRVFHLLSAGPVLKRRARHEAFNEIAKKLQPCLARPVRLKAVQLSQGWTAVPLRPCPGGNAPRRALCCNPCVAPTQLRCLWKPPHAHPVPGPPGSTELQRRAQPPADTAAAATPRCAAAGGRGTFPPGNFAPPGQRQPPGAGGSRERGWGRVSAPGRQSPTGHSWQHGSAQASGLTARVTFCTYSHRHGQQLKAGQFYHFFFFFHIFFL